MEYSLACGKFNVLSGISSILFDMLCTVCVLSIVCQKTLIQQYHYCYQYKNI